MCLWSAKFCISTPNTVCISAVAADNIAINFVGEWRFCINWKVISKVKQKGQTYDPKPCIINFQIRWSSRLAAPPILGTKSDHRAVAYTRVFTVLKISLKRWMTYRHCSKNKNKNLIQSNFANIVQRIAWSILFLRKEKKLSLREFSFFDQIKLEVKSIEKALDFTSMKRNARKEKTTALKIPLL